METCVLIRPFGKYILFGTQLYEIWKPAFNMKIYIFFMHSKPAGFFVPRLPFFFSTCTHHPLFPPSLPPKWNRLTLCRHHHWPPLTPLSGQQSPLSPFPSLFLSLSFLFDITKREEGDDNGGEPGPKGRRRGWLPLTVTTSNSRGHWQ